MFFIMTSTSRSGTVALRRLLFWHDLDDTVSIARLDCNKHLALFRSGLAFLRLAASGIRVIPEGLERDAHMCGICGVYNFDTSELVDGHLIEGMTSRLAHRGPNGWGKFIVGNVGLGHRRLSVIDLEAGAQPMTDATTGRTIVYNGEFYNFAAVRSELLAQGVTFRTRSDTEVLLKLQRIALVTGSDASTACSRWPSGIPHLGHSR